MALVTRAIGGIALYETETRLVATTGDTLALAAADIADKLDLLLFERYADMQILAQAPVFQGHDQDAINRYLTSFKRIYSVYQWFVLTDRNGRTLTATDVQAFGQDNSGQNWFVQVRDRGGVHMQDEQASDETAKAVAVSLAAPVLGPHGEFPGVVRTGVSLPALEDGPRRHRRGGAVARIFALDHRPLAEGMAAGSRRMRARHGRRSDAQGKRRAVPSGGATGDLGPRRRASTNCPRVAR